MAVAGFVQSATFSQKVVAKTPPPEGSMAASVQVVLTPTVYNLTNFYNLNSSGNNGLALSQVVSLTIDNTANLVPVTVVHGVMQETCVVPAGTLTTVPTFSNTAGYPVNVFTASAPGANVNVNLIFMNYERQAGSVPNTVQNTIINTSQNSKVLYSNLIALSSTGTVAVLSAGNWILDNLNTNIEYVIATAIGAWNLQLGIQQQGGVNFHSQQAGGGASAAGQVFGLPSFASDRIWPQGFVLPRGGSVNLVCSTFTNITQAIVRINITGYNAP